MNDNKIARRSASMALIASWVSRFLSGIHQNTRPQLPAGFPFSAVKNKITRELDQNRPAQERIMYSVWFSPNGLDTEGRREKRKTLKFSKTQREKAKGKEAGTPK